MSSVNKVILTGNLGADPEVRTFQNGGKVVNLRVATSERWRDRNPVRTGNGRNGTRLPSFLNRWPVWPNSTCARAPRSISKASLKPANGKTNRARIATAPRLFCVPIAAS